MSALPQPMIAMQAPHVQIVLAHSLAHAMMVIMAMGRRAQVDLLKHKYFPLHFADLHL